MQGSLFEPLLPDRDTPDEQVALATVAKPNLRNVEVGAEIATYQRGEFLQPITIYEFPNLSTIQRDRTNGEGIRFYDTMMLTDADMSGFFRDLADNTLHHPMYVRAASPSTEHQLHKRFVEYVMGNVHSFQNVLRHFLDCYPRGFSVTEKIYEVVARGEWTGAVVWAEMLDKPARWFTFDIERRLRLKTVDNNLPGVLLPQEKFAVFSYGTNSTPWGDPLLDGCYWPWFLRHHAFKNQAIFFEKWATPTAKIEYELTSNQATNKRNREEALAVVNAIQADTVIALPKGMVLSLIESSRNGTISFEQYVDQLRNILSRLITGQILLGSGDKGGSYAMARVHQEQEDNRVEALSNYLARRTSREFRELIDRNFGPQEAYPRIEILSRNFAEQQAFLEIEGLKLVNGHKISQSWSDTFLQSVLPTSPEDQITPPPGVIPPQPTAIPGNLAEEDPWQARSRRIRAFSARVQAPAKVELARPENHREAHALARETAQEIRAHLDEVGVAAAGKARPAIRRAVKSMASRIRGKKTIRSITKSFLLKGLKGYDGAGLGEVFETMLDSPRAPHAMAEGDEPPDISDSAKLALALLMFAIVESIAAHAAEALDDMSPADFANSLMDENAASGSVAETYSNIFLGTHGTNIASIATGKLRIQLADPDFRQSHPYVMIVTRPDARFTHSVMDGYILSAEDAQFSAFLPPYDFGCRCVPVPITAATARSLGLTGAAPTGTIGDYVRANGGTMTTSGPSPGFLPAFMETDNQTQLAALRDKARLLQREDPEAWSSMVIWLVWLFAGFNPLTEDPPPEEEAIQ